MTDVTRILSAIEQGDPHAAAQLLPLLYDELRQLAAQKLAHEAPGQTLQATALVHEAYLRLVDLDKAQHWNSRGHFFAAAAEAMRRILIDNARRKGRQKRGGARRQRVDLDSQDLVAHTTPDELLLLDDALAALTAEEPEAGQLVNADFRSPPNFPERPPTCPAMATGGNASGCRWRPRCSYRHGHSRRTQRSASHGTALVRWIRHASCSSGLCARLLNRTTISSAVILTLPGVSTNFRNTVCGLA